MAFLRHSSCTVSERGLASSMILSTGHNFLPLFKMCMACAMCGLWCSLCLILMCYLFGQCNTCHIPGTWVYIYTSWVTLLLFMRKWMCMNFKYLNVGQHVWYMLTSLTSTVPYNFALYMHKCNRHMCIPLYEHYDS